jgi:hypothetical protein
VSDSGAQNRVLSRACRGSVVGQLDLDHSVDLVVRPPGLVQALLDCGQQLVGVELGALAGGTDEPVADPSGVTGDDRAARGDVHRDAASRPVIDGGVGRLVVLAVERDPLAGPQGPHQVDGLAEPGEALLEVGPLQAGDGDLVQRFAGTDADHDAVGVEAGQGGERLGHHGRVVAKGRGHHRSAELDAVGPFADGGQPGQREGSMTTVVLPGLEVVGDADTVQTQLLGPDGELHQVARVELLG